MAIHVGETETQTLTNKDLTNVTNDVRGTRVLASGLESAKPAFGTAGRTYLSTDTGLLWHDDGTAWIQVADGGAVGDHGGLVGLADDDHTQYVLASGARDITGVQSHGSDVVVDLGTKGLVLKDTQGTPHYWRVRVSNLGILSTTDLGTIKPA